MTRPVSSSGRMPKLLRREDSPRDVHRYAAPMARRLRLPPIIVDGLIAAGLFGLALLSRVDIGEEAGAFSREPDGLNLVLIAAQTLPLVLRRRYPVTVMVAILAAFATDRILDYPSTLATSGIILAIHAVGSELPARRSLRVGSTVVIGTTLFTIAGALTLDSIGLAAVATTFLFTALPLILGREVFQRRRRVEALEERAETAEREREERAARAVAEERARIARELHDVVAHQMTVMTVQAEGARRIAGNIDPRVTDALATISEAGHQGLSEMRRMVGLLRTGPGVPEFAPQPGVDRLDSLIDQMRDAGLEVTFDRQGEPLHLAPGVDVNLYRIVQESLTNTLRHGGPGVHARVRLHVGSDDIELHIEDDGRGGASLLNGDVGGHGLVGMRERVALLDGTFEAGPRPGGGFSVRVGIPVRS